ncbi:MAG: hypothetical protein EBS68_10530 [Rhodobacteraceae bacterium]|nr:hypothetical protein [Paracoccaceae bacterium]
MEIIDIIRLATERAEQTGDLHNPEFHDVVCVIGGMSGDHALAETAKGAGIALRKAQAAQMEFRRLFEK